MSVVPQKGQALTAGPGGCQKWHLLAIAVTPGGGVPGPHWRGQLLEAIPHPLQWHLSLSYCRKPCLLSRKMQHWC